VTNGANVTIQNGIIVGFLYGVLFNYPGRTPFNSGNIVQNLRVTNATYGVALYDTTGSIVRNNQITASNGGIAIDIIGLGVGPGGNLASGNVVSGFGDGFR
jgi:parallel beta-helix repeat protein